MEVLFFPNGNTAVLDKGKQVSKLQKSWLILFAEYLESEGIDPTGVSFAVPSGRKVEVFKIPDGYNWRITNGK